MSVYSGQILAVIQNIFIDGSLPNSISFIIIALLQTRVYSWRRGVHPYQKALVLNPPFSSVCNIASECAPIVDLISSEQALCAPQYATNVYLRRL